MKQEWGRGSKMQRLPSKIDPLSSPICRSENIFQLFHHLVGGGGEKIYAFSNNLLYYVRVELERVQFLRQNLPPESKNLNFGTMQISGGGCEAHLLYWDFFPLCARLLLPINLTSLVFIKSAPVSAFLALLIFCNL